MRSRRLLKVGVQPAGFSRAWLLSIFPPPEPSAAGREIMSGSISTGKDGSLASVLAEGDSTFRR